MTGIRPRNRYTQLGLWLAAAISGFWLAIHIFSIFFWQFSLVTAPLALIIIMVQCWLNTGLFIIAHDCMHGSLVPGRPKVNAALGTVLLGAYAGLSFAVLLPKHQAHHAAPGTAHDPDFHAVAPTQALPWFIAFFRNYYTHVQILRIVFAATLYLLLGASLLNIFVFWAVPALLALGQLFVFGTYLPHRHNGQSFADEHNARSSSLRPILSLITCFHFGAYHHEHHLSPGTPWWRLPALRQKSPARE